MAADGSIVFEANIDSKDLNNQLTKLAKDIKKKTENLTKRESEKLGVKSELDAARAAADKTSESVRKLKDELAKVNDAMDYRKAGPETDPTAFLAAYEQKGPLEAKLKAQEDALADQQKTVESCERKYAKITADIDEQRKALDAVRADAEGLEKQLQPAVAGSTAMGEALNNARAYMDKFTDRVKKLAKRVFVFTVITSALRSVKNWMVGVVQKNAEANAAMAQLRGALLTLAQPLAEIIIPLFTALVKLLTRVVSTIAQMIAYITGKPISAMKSNAEALNNQADAIDNVGSAAKNASKYLAGFDELNVMDSGDSGGGSSGGGGSTPGADFSFDTSATEDKIKNLLLLIEMGAAALLGWKFGNSFWDGLQKTIGYFLIIDGAIRTIKNLLDAWNNGVTFENLNGALVGVTELVLGLYLAFGATAAGIGLVVSGISLLVTGLHDAMKVGFNAQNLLMTISGILLTSVGIATLTGSWIPLLIGGIAALLLIITTAFGDSESLLKGFKNILNGFLEFFTGIFTGDIEKAIGGIGKIFSGLTIVFDVVLDSLQNMITRALDWLDEKTGGKFHWIIETIKSVVTSGFKYIKDVVGSVIKGIKDVFTGLIEFISGVFTGDWDRAWKGIKDVFEGIVNGIKGVFISVINLIIRALNWLIEKANKISFTVPDWVPGIGGKHVGINIGTIQEYPVPHLAKGAVIPANREFLAVLGDQKRGTNIEAPADLIRQIVREEVKNSGGGNHITIVLDSVNGKKIFDAVVKENNAVVRATGASPLVV